MNKEQKIKIILIVLIVCSLFISSMEFLYLDRKVPLFIIPAAIFGALLVILEIYLRIQHNIDRKFVKSSIVLGNKLNTMDNKFNVFNNKLNTMDNKFNVFNNKLNTMDNKFNVFNNKLNAMSNQFNMFDNKMSHSIKQLTSSNMKNETTINEISAVQKDIMRTMLKEKLNLNSKKEDVTVILGVKNRYDYRIINAFKSIRNQDFPQNLLKILLVDYGSNSELVPKLKKLCKKYKAEYIRLQNVSEWNRSNCLNIGLNKANTRYVLISDIDIIFESNYIKEALKKIKDDSLQIVYSKMHRSNKEDISSETEVIKEYKNLLKKTMPPYQYSHGNNDYWGGMSIIFALRELVLIIGGYDENYKLWGNEDTDLIKRMSLAGVKILDISKSTSHIHQWHEKFEGLKDFEDQISKNKKYLEENNSIFRNNKR